MSPTPDDLAPQAREQLDQIERARGTRCPTCSPPVRVTVGMVCQTCGIDYSGGAR